MNNKILFQRILCILALALTIMPGPATSSPRVKVLLDALEQQENIETRAQIHLEIAQIYEQELNDLSKAISFYKKVLPKDFASKEALKKSIKDYSPQHNYRINMALAMTGSIYLKNNKTEEAERYLLPAHDLALMLNNIELALFCMNHLAVHFAQSRHHKGLLYFEKTYEIYQLQENQEGMIYSLGNMGALSANSGNYYKAAEYYKTMLKLQESTGEAINEGSDLRNIAMLYTRIEEYENAIPFWERLLHVSIEKEALQDQLLCYTQLALSYFKTQELEKSYRYYDKLKILSAELGDKKTKLLALNNLAIITFQINHHERSIGYWLQALELGMETSDGNIVFDALISLSKLYGLEGNNEKSLEYYHRYHNLAAQTDNPQFSAKSYYNMGEIQMQAENYESAEEYFSTSLTYYKTMHSPNHIAKTKNKIAFCFLQNHQTHKAYPVYLEVLEAQTVVEPEIYAEALWGLGDVYRYNRQFEAALNAYEGASQIFISERKYNKATAALNAMANIQEIYGNLPAALSHYEQALELAGLMANMEAEAAIHNNMGVIYRQLGDLPRSKGAYNQALKLYSQTHNNSALAYCYNNLGVIYEQNKDYDTAHTYYEKAREILQSNYQTGLGSSLLNMGNIQRFKGNLTEAELLYREGLNIFKEENDTRGEAMMLANLSALNIEMLQYDRAIELANQSRYLSETGGFIKTLREAHRQLAWAYYHTEVFEWAEEAHLIVIQMIHEEINRNFSILSESEKEAFFETVAGDFDRFHSFALQRQEANPSIVGEVYNNILRNKGLLLKSSTAMRNAILSSNNTELIEQFSRWITLKEQIAHLYSLPKEQHDHDIEKKEAQANELERYLVRSSPEFSELTQNESLHWKQIQEKLNHDDIAIEFTHFTTPYNQVQYCALFLRKDDPYPMMVPLFYEKELEEVLGQFAGNNRNYINRLYGEKTSLAPELHQIIWKPLQAYLEEIKNVYYAPSGLLHKVSFSAININKNKLLSDKFTLYNLSTTQHAGSDYSITFSPETQFSLFGGITYSIESKDHSWSYLGGTLSEVAQIQEILETQFPNTMVLTDTVARESQFKKTAAQSHIIHVATHGFFYPDPEQIDLAIQQETEFGDIDFRGGTPGFGVNTFVRNSNSLMRSGLVFAGVNDYWSGEKAVKEEDGVLTALEAINIDLRNNQLLVLSACETGLGEIRGSEGVYGLQRAFKMAGTRHIIMSLWQVPDKETAEFMIKFYQLLIQKGNIHTAFSGAQTYMRSQYDPFFWAAFVLIE